jgi:hypothetical protein
MQCKHFLLLLELSYFATNCFAKNGLGMQMKKNLLHTKINDTIATAMIYSDRLCLQNVSPANSIRLIGLFAMIGETAYIYIYIYTHTHTHTLTHTHTKVVRKRRFPMIFHNEKHVYWH